MAGYLPFHDKNIMAMYKKIYKGEFRCARWFSKDLTSLLTRAFLTLTPTLGSLCRRLWSSAGSRKNPSLSSSISRMTSCITLWTMRMA
ncbi:hypothetical protein SORBI_3003G303400 [Sorghum bicolor]|uniref:Uncharacterized protein n=1 Tax=Sorghum bicolor TaxID=4558 RepID=A0A1B6Q683_SORBI|nr:hypothetical protein SORBI_3003G303400 [Sorghum bicolor]